MKCVVPSQNVKILGRGVHSLAKIGEELYIEPKDNVLTFRTVSVSQSALAEFNMSSSFFSSYSFASEDGDIKCKVAMKSCLNVFRSSHHFEKNVESCEMRLKPDGNVVIFFIKFSNSSTRKYFLPIIDSEKIEVNYEKNVPNKFICSSKLLSSSMKNFRSNEDEITIKVTSSKMNIKNHLELRRDKSLMRTEVSFEPTEFDCYQAQVEGAVTFCLKELRSAVSFAEPAGLPITLLLNTAGLPVIVQVANQPAYEMSYVIATLRASLMEADATMNTPSSSAAVSEPQRLGSTPSATTSRHKDSPVELDPPRPNVGVPTFTEAQTNASMRFTPSAAADTKMTSQPQQRGSGVSVIPPTGSQVPTTSTFRTPPTDEREAEPNTSGMNMFSDNASQPNQDAPMTSQRMFPSICANVGVVLETPDELPPSPPPVPNQYPSLNPNLPPELSDLIQTVFRRCFMPPSLPPSPSVILAEKSDSE